MFEAFTRVRKPRSILDIVDESILQSLMQGFFYRQGSGMMVMYDVEAENASLVYRELEPFPAGDSRNREQFHPFCRAFREESRRDSLCRDCDLVHAKRCFSAADRKLREYTCHMGLLDLNFPLDLNGRVRAIIYAGQRVPEWAPNAIEKITSRVRQEFPPGPEQDQLIQLAIRPLSDLRPAHGQSMRKPARSEWEELKHEFEKLGTTVQRIVTALYEARCGEALREAILEISHRQEQFVPSGHGDWKPSVTVVLRELESLLESRPIAFLVLNRSRYFVQATSPSAAHLLNKSVRPAPLFALPDDEWIDVSANVELKRILFPEDLEKLGRSPPLIHRFSTSASSESAHAVFVLTAGLMSELERRLLTDGCRELAHMVQLSQVFDRNLDLRVESERELAFVGHTLKTPLQSLRFQVWHLRRLSNDMTPDLRQKVKSLSDHIEQSLVLALADAAQLQTAAKDHRQVFDLKVLIAEVVKEFADLAANRRVQIVVSDQALGSAFWVNAVRAHIRVAFKNLMDNAVKYSYTARDVKVRIFAPSPRDAAVDIENFGVGIAPDKKQHLFTMGVRAPSVDEKVERRGSGIGLSLAQQFLLEAGGTLELDDRPLSSNTVSGPFLVTASITLPRRIAK